MLGFFFNLAEEEREPSISRIELALAGKPRAMAEAEVCWETDKGSFDLS